MRAKHNKGDNVKPTAIDLFSGCGGLTVGLKQAGFNVISAIECWNVAAQAYQSNHPSVKLVTSDIREVDAGELMQSLGLSAGQLDLLAGCPPCQGFSSLRTLNGTRSVTDQQNDLIFEFLRLALAFQPKTILLENVPALKTDQRLEEVVDALQQDGYECAFEVLDAADYGVPQRRRRLLLLASRIGTVEFPIPVKKRVTVRDAFRDMPVAGESGDKLHDQKATHSERIAAIIRQIPPDGGSRRDLGPDAQLPCHRRIDGFHDIYGRMKWDDVSPTITTGCINPSKGRFLHPSEHRAISLREASLLQGFPRHYKLPLDISRYVVAQMIGNAFPPEFVRRQAMQLHRRLANPIPK